jgi:hypothetical protein
MARYPSAMAKLAFLLGHTPVNTWPRITTSLPTTCNAACRQRWSNTRYPSYTRPGTRGPLTGDAAYRAAIARHHFASHTGFQTPQTDSQIVAAMQQVGGYRVVAVLPCSSVSTQSGAQSLTKRRTGMATTERTSARA